MKVFGLSLSQLETIFVKSGLDRDAAKKAASITSAMISSAHEEGQQQSKNTNVNKRIDNPFAENTKPKKK